MAASSSAEELASSSTSTTIHDDLSDDNIATGSRLRVKKVTLSWHNIVVTRRERKGKYDWCCRKRPVTVPKKLLSNVYGEVRPGELLAVMGSSGAGKTTLMNVLTGKNLNLLKVRGRVLINGKKISSKMKKLMCYVEQDDIFMGTLSVREHLVYQALLRMDRRLTRKQKMERVDEVLGELRLRGCMNTVIGVPGRLKGASGGEKKRLAFASELLTNPSLLFCDEPTSGLDSYMARNLVIVLRDLVATGRTVLCTIHQPSSEVYAMFSNILFLTNGRAAFMGTAEGAARFFAGVNLICPSNQNPADFYIQKLSVTKNTDEVTRDQVTIICNLYDESEYAKRFRGTIHCPEDHDEEVGNVEPRKSEISFLYQTWVLFLRSARCLKREPILTTARLTQAVVIGLILALCFWQQKFNQTGIMNINGAMFMMLTNMTVQNGFAVMTTFCIEVPVFAREHSTGLYGTLPYFIGKTMAELPVFVMVPIIYSSILYWSVGLRPETLNFVNFLIVAVLVANTGCSFGYMISCLTGSAAMAVTLAPPLFVPMMLFGGFYLNAQSVPSYVIWLKYLSWYNYAYPILIHNQWEGVDYIQCGKPNSTDCLTTGQQVIEHFQFENEVFSFNFAMLAVLFVFYRMLAYVVLVLRVKLKFI